MEQNMTPLSQVNADLDNIKILVRCISIWKPHSPSNPKDIWSLYMIFQDQQGNRIHATTNKFTINKFQLLFDVGACYRIANFGVGQTSGRYPLLNHKFKISLFKNTSVTRVDNFDNNIHGYRFEPFPNFTARIFLETELVDVIGTVVTISDCIPFNNFGVDKIRRNLTLADVDGVQLECCFFDEWAKKFDKLYEKRDSIGHVVVILQLAKCKTFNGKPSITNASYATNLWINDDIPEIAAFKEMYTGGDDFDPNKVAISTFTPVKKVLTPEQFYEGGIRKMISSIRDSEKKYDCILYARIHKIHREHGWAYLACKRCGRVAKEATDDEASSSSGKKKKKEQLWNCKIHKGLTKVETGIRYKLIVRVTDDTGSASLLLFDELVHKLSGSLCYTLLNQHGFNYDDYFPDELNVMVGKKMLFRFEYDEYNINNNHHVYQVVRISDDETMINMFSQDLALKAATDDVHDVQTPISNTGKLSKLAYVDSIPFNMEETPKADKEIQANEGESSNSGGSGKRVIIDLDDYNEEQEEAKRATKIVKVKIEPTE